MTDWDDALVDGRDIPAALARMTRLPVEPGTRGDRAAWAWPLAGGLVALIAGVAGWILLGLGLLPGIAAAAVLASMMLMTGAMHEDGLARFAEGGGGGLSVARRLDIMASGRPGTPGLLALVLVTLARWSALSFLMATGHLLAPLIAAAMISRAALPVAMIGLPPAATADTAGKPPPQAAAIGLILTLVVSLLLTGWAAIPAIVVAAALIVLVAILTLARIGGRADATLGTMQQLAEVAALAVFAAAF